jgi:hypothetical protein
MNAHSRGRAHHRRPRGLHVESLEDRLLLSSAPFAPAPEAALPTEGPSTPALTAGLTGAWSPGDESPAALVSAPTRDWVGPIAPGHDGLAPVDGPTTAVVTPLPHDDRPDGAWSGPWSDRQATVFTAPLAVAGPNADVDRLSILAGGLLVPASDQALPAYHPTFPTVSLVLGIPWSGHEWYGGWDDYRPIHLLMLTDRLPGADTPAPASGPQLNFGYESSAPAGVSPIVLPMIEVGSLRGAAPGSTGPAGEVSERLAHLAALAGTEAAAERLSADASRQGPAAVKDPVRPVVSTPARLSAAPGVGLLDPASSAVSGGAAQTGDSGAVALPPVGAAPAGAQEKLILPAGDGGAAPAAEALDAAPAQPAGGLDLTNLPSRAAALLEGGLPFDLPALTQGVDAFFARLGSPGPARDHIPAYARVVPWLAVLSAAALEFARRRQQLAAAGDEVLVGPAVFLPHRDEER